MTDFVWFWLILGAVLIGAELIVPGLVVVFLGVAALIVGGAVYFGAVEHWMNAFTLWFVVSLGLIVALRSTVQRLFPPEVSHREVDDDADALGQIVEVLEEVGSDHARGRISYRGASWSAVAMDAPIPAGSKARLLYRENLSWVVEPVDALEAGFDDEGPRDAGPGQHTEGGGVSS